MAKYAAALVLAGSIINNSAGGKTCYPCTPSIKELFFELCGAHHVEDKNFFFTKSQNSPIIQKV